MPFRAARALAALFLATAVLGASADAEAYVLKRAESGAPVRWRTAEVSFVLEDSAEKVKGARDAAADAARAWSGLAGAPEAKVEHERRRRVPEMPAVDGTNVVLRASPEEFSPLGHALAVTVLSYDERSGAIVDADIVLSAAHRLETLPRKKAHAVRKDAHAVSAGEARFDIGWVLAHEMGHALGLGDDPSAEDALMYPFVAPDVAGPGAPTPADLDGIEALYDVDEDAGDPAGPVPASCAVAPGSTPARFAGAILATLGAVALLRRRKKSAAVAGACALVLLVPDVRSETSLGTSWASARVVEARTLPDEASGVLRTDLLLALEGGGRARAARWGGVSGGLRQVVGHAAAPRAGDEVLVRTRRAMPAPAVFGPRVSSGATDIVVRTRSRP